MKTITLTEETFNDICDVLVDTINGRVATLEFLIKRFGLDSSEARAEEAELNRLDELETVFRAAGECAKSLG